MPNDNSNHNIASNHNIVNATQMTTSNAHRMVVDDVIGEANVPTTDALPTTFTDRFRALTPDTYPSTLAVMVGCGNLGSATALAMLRMGFQVFRLIDPDSVEPPNIATQQFNHGHIGMSKVSALAWGMASVRNPVVNGGPHIRQHFSRIEELDPPLIMQPPNYRIPITRGIVLALTDNLDSRRHAYMDWCRSGCQSRLFIDARMAGEFFLINAVLPMVDGVDDPNRDAYESLLNNPPPTYEAPCGASSLGSTGIVVAGFISTITRRWMNGVNIPHIITGDLTGTVESHWATPEEPELETLTRRRMMEE